MAADDAKARDVAEKIKTDFVAYGADGAMKFTDLLGVFRGLSKDFSENDLRTLCMQVPLGERENGSVDIVRFLDYIFSDTPASGLRLLSKTMASENGRLELKALFDRLDKDNNGRVSSKEWGKSITENRDALARFFGGTSMKDIGMAFNRIDLDQSKDLSWDEFVASTAECAMAYQISDVMATSEGRAELKALFDTLDKDSSGQISSKEWGKGLSQNKELMAKYFGGATMAEIGRAFNRIDANCDKQLTWEEIVNATLNFRQQ